MGGILADEMGLGKTVMALALIAETLIVVPKSVVSQWMKEIQLHFKDSIVKTHCYYNLPERKGKINLTDYDIIITTYAIMGMDYADKYPNE
jgi:DNA repair protein RAD5